MKQRTVWAVAIIALLFSTAFTARAQMVPAGDYTNMRYTQGECLGYDLMLWKMNGQVYGVISYCAGLTGDTPTGYIDHVVWDAKTGKLTFDAKLTIGNDGRPGKDGKDVMSKDSYQFDGTLTAALLSGKMTHEDMAADHPSPDTAAVRLKLDKGLTKQMDKYPTSEAWKAYNDSIMADRGPKW